MKHVNCPICGRKLFEGESGSHIIVKCCKCGELFESIIQNEQITIKSVKKSFLTIDKNNVVCN